MHSIKSYSANRIQRLLNIQGSVWQDENYDRIIRDEEEYLEKMNYIVNNPLKAMIVENPEDYRWLFFEGMEWSIYIHTFTGRDICDTDIPSPNNTHKQRRLWHHIKLTSPIILC
jgi:hypothetical protein